VLVKRQRGGRRWRLDPGNLSMRHLLLVVVMGGRRRQLDSGSLSMSHLLLIVVMGGRRWLGNPGGVGGNQTVLCGSDSLFVKSAYYINKDVYHLTMHRLNSGGADCRNLLGNAAITMNTSFGEASATAFTSGGYLSLTSRPSGDSGTAWGGRSCGNPDIGSCELFILPRNAGQNASRDGRAW
jgi:hypothetical protein